MSIPFGTDGWRGVIAEDCTFDAVLRVASATARVYLSGTGPGDRGRILVGYDTRFFSPEFALAASEVFARAGIDVLHKFSPDADSLIQGRLGIPNLPIQLGRTLL